MLSVNLNSFSFLFFVFFNSRFPSAFRYNQYSRVAYQDNRVFLEEQVSSQSLGFDRQAASCHEPIGLFETIGQVETKKPLRPSDRRLAQGWKLAEKGDEGDDGDEEDGEEDIAKNCHDLL